LSARQPEGSAAATGARCSGMADVPGIMRA
jgi:hypothetical protein